MAGPIIPFDVGIGLLTYKYMYFIGYKVVGCNTKKFMQQAQLIMH